MYSVKAWLSRTTETTPFLPTSLNASPDRHLTPNQRFSIVHLSSRRRTCLRSHRPFWHSSSTHSPSSVLAEARAPKRKKPQKYPVETKFPTTRPTAATTFPIPSKRFCRHALSSCCWSAYTPLHLTTAERFCCCCCCCCRDPCPKTADWNGSNPQSNNGAEKHRQGF